MANISTTSIEFLSDLAGHNERKWFNANKPKFEAAQTEFLVFLDRLIVEITNFDQPIGELSANECVLRIYRDTRFSKDKTPYKTSLNAHILAGGRKNERGRAGYYVHIEPGASFLAGGAYLPRGEWMAAIRKQIATNGDELRKITRAKAFKTCFGNISGEKLRTAPRGYAKNHPEIELLKFKSFTACHKVKDQIVTGPRFVSHAAKVFKLLAPFDAFLNR